MQNPDFRNFTLDEMFDISHRGATNSSKLHLENYTVPKHYHDSFNYGEKQVGQIKINSDFTKVKKINKKHFMHDLIKEQSQKPGPGQYLKTKKWLQEQHELKEKSKTLHKKKLNTSNIVGKETVFTQLQSKQKKNRYPSPAQYSINRSFFDEKQGSLYYKKQRSYSPQPRTTYLDDITYQSNLIPGAGNYYPHKPYEIKKVFVDNRDQKYWQKKNTDTDEKRKERKRKESPGVGKYFPTPSDYQTFDTMKKKEPRIKPESFNTNLKYSKSASLSPKNYGKHLPHLGFGVSKKISVFDSDKKLDVQYHKINYQWKAEKLPQLQKKQSPNSRNAFEIQSKAKTYQLNY